MFALHTHTVCNWKTHGSLFHAENALTYSRHSPSILHTVKKWIVNEPGRVGLVPRLFLIEEKAWVRDKQREEISLGRGYWKRG